jgi:hypothetical protein
MFFVLVEGSENQSANMKNHLVQGANVKTRAPSRKPSRADRIIAIFLFVCIFYACFNETDKKIVIFLCVLSHTEKVKQLFCQFSYFFVRIFVTDTLITNFSVCTEKMHRKIHHLQAYSSFQQ